MIINADDLGYSDAVNQAVFAAIEARRVNSASLMVYQPGFDSAVQFLRHHPEIAVGLHFDITESRHCSLRLTIWHLVLGKLTLSEVRRELAKQYAALERTGLSITHLDSHEHLHLYPPLYRLFIDFAKTHHIPLVRGGSYRSHLNLPPKGLLIRLLYAVNERLYSSESVKLTNFALDLNWYEVYHRELASVFAGIHHNSEVICHLTTSEDKSRFATNRQGCSSFLLGKVFGKILASYEMDRPLK